MLGPLKQDWGTIGVLTLPADNGTWSVTLTASSKDTELRALRHPDSWARVARLLPLHRPLDRRGAARGNRRNHGQARGPYPRFLRRVASRSPPALIAVADSWSCTNPSLGRGASVGLLHATALRDHLAKAGDPWELASGWAQVTSQTVEPWYRTTLGYDRHRLGEIHSLMEGRTYETDDEFWHLNRALEASATADGDNVRALLDMGMVAPSPRRGPRRSGDAREDPRRGSTPPPMSRASDPTATN